MSDEIGECCVENENCSKLNKQGVCVCEAGGWGWKILENLIAWVWWRKFPLIP